MGFFDFFKGAAIVVLALISTSCLRQTPVSYGAHPVTPQEKPMLLTSTPADLNNRLIDTYNSINSFQARTEMVARLGSVYRSATIDQLTYSATTLILFRKPTGLRLEGTSRIVGRLFDMASNGPGFNMLIPAKSLFVTGLDSTPASSTNPIENMRPSQLLSAILVKPADLATDRIFLQDDTDVDHSWYVLQIARKGPNDSDLPDRTIWFDRITFNVVRQRIFDKDGLITNETKYDKWQAFNGILFPTHIEASFKKDGYGVVIDTSIVKINGPMTDEQFTLQRPEGYTLRDLNAAR